MITSIELTNWRSHANTLFEFKKGTNILVGIMGAGKSSVLEGISFGFFGTFPALERRKLKLDDLIRLNEASAKVTLSFSWQNNHYKIERKILRNKKSVSTEAEIYKNNALVEHGQSAVTTYVSNVLNIDYDLFTRAIYSEQNNLDYFLNIDPKRRKEEIDALLGLDKLETARSNATSVASKMRLRKEELEKQFDQNKLSEFEKTLGEQENKAIELQKQHESLNYEKHNQEFVSSQKTYEESKKTKEHFESMEKESIKLDALIELLKKDSLEVDDSVLVNANAELKKHELIKAESISKLKVFEKDFFKSKENLTKIEISIRQIEESEKKILALETEIKKIEENNSKDQLIAFEQELQKELFSLESDSRSLDRELKENLELIEKMRPGQTICILCSSPIANIEHLKKEKENLHYEKKKKQLDIQANLTEKKKIFSMLSSKVKKLNLLYEQKNHIETEKSKYDLTKLVLEQKSLADLATKISIQRTETQKNIDRINLDLEKTRFLIKEVETKIKKKKEMDIALNNKADLSIRLKSISFNKDEFEKQRLALEEKKLLLQKILSEKNTLLLQLKFLDQSKESCIKEIQRIKNLETNIQKLSSVEEHLLIYKNALFETQIWLRKNLLDAINQAMNEIWALFYPHKNYEKIRISATDKDYVLEMFDGNNWKNIETIASGGERSSGALVLRVALSIVLTPQLSWLVLDEPTHNLDRQAVELLSNTLQFNIPQVVNQIFVITHDETLMGSDFASSYKLFRDKANNGETKAEKI